MLLKKLLILGVGIPLGLAIIKYRERIQRFTGPFAFAETWLGTGGTYTVIFLFGCAVVVGTILYFLGAHEILLAKFVGKIGF